MRGYGGAENAGMKNAAPENAGGEATQYRKHHQSAVLENAGPEIGTHKEHMRSASEAGINVLPNFE